MSLSTPLKDQAVEVTTTVITPSEEKMITAVKSSKAVERLTEITAGDFRLSTCCCGCPLAAGVLLISWLEALSWGFHILVAIFVLFLKTQEHKIDQAIRRYFKDCDDSSNTEEGSSEPSADDIVAKTNDILKIAAFVAPFLIAMSLIGMYFSGKGMTAANKGDLNTAKKYMLWKGGMIVWALAQFSYLEWFGVLPFGLAIYFYLAVRSYYLSLLDNLKGNELVSDSAV